MKRFPVIFTLILLVLSGCANLNKVKYESCKITNQSGKVIEEWFFRYDKERRIINERRWRVEGDYYWNQSKTYNADGGVREIIDYERDEIIYSTTRFEYIAGKRVKEYKYDKKNKLIRYSVCEFSSMSSEVWVDYNTGNKILSKEKSRFNNDGKVIERIIYDANGNITGRQYYKYLKPNSKCFMMRQVNPKESLKIHFEYDEHENLTKRIEYRNGIIQKNWGYKYTYDSNGNIVTETFYDKGLKKGSQNFSYRDDNVKLIKFYIRYDNNNLVTEKGEFQYKFYN